MRTHRTALSLQLGFFGLVSAFYVADFWKLEQAGREGTARGVLVFTIPLVAAALGWVLGLERLRRSSASTAAVVVVGTVAAGLAIGAITGASFARGTGIGSSVEMGLYTSLALLPLVAAMTVLDRRIGRARVGSVVDDVDRRAPWVVVLATAAAGRVALSFNGGVLTWSATREPLPNTISIGLAWLALVGALAVLGSDVVAWGRVGRARRRIAEMTPRAPACDGACDDFLDLGVGDEAHEQRAEGPAYRTAHGAVAVVKGSPELAAPLTGHAALRSVAIVGAAVLALTVLPLLRIE